MAIQYAVDGVSFTSINAACTEIEASHDYDTDGMANVDVSITTADSTHVTIDDAFTGTPDVNSHIRIEATGAAKHGGHFTTSKQRLQASSSGHLLTINEDWVHLKFLQFEQESSVASDECIRLMTGTDNLLIEKCVLKVADVSQCDCIYAGNWAVDEISVFDCAITCGGGSSRVGIHSQLFNGSSLQTWRIEHCTVNGNGVNATEEGGIVVKASDIAATVNMHVDNCISYDTEFDARDYLATGNGTVNWDGQGNISSDASATGKLGATGNQDDAEVDADNDSGTDVQITTVDADYQIIDGLDNGLAIANAIDAVTRDARIDLTLDCASNPRPGTFTDRDSGAFQHIVSSGDRNIIATLVNVAIADVDASINATRNLVASLVDVSIADLDSVLGQERDISASLVDVAVGDIDAVVTTDRDITAALLNVPVADLDATVELTSDRELNATVVDIGVADVNANVSTDRDISATLVDVAVTTLDAVIGRARDIIATVVTVTVEAFDAIVTGPSSPVAAFINIVQEIKRAILRKIGFEPVETRRDDV